MCVDYTMKYTFALSAKQKYSLFIRWSTLN